MYLYNITVIISEQSEAQWLGWLTEQAIPAVMAENYFISHRLFRVVDSPNEGSTYCLQYVADTREQVDDYLSAYNPTFQAQQSELFTEQFVMFSTLMEFV